MTTAPSTEQSLTEFLLARIAEDEAPTWGLVAVPEWMGSPAGFVGHCCFICDETMYSGTPRAMTDSAENHGERIHRRSRVLAEATAKRAIVELHRPGSFTDASLGIRDAKVCTRCHVVLDEEAHGYPWVQESWPCRTLRALASMYADHEAYRQEWAL